MTQKIVLASGNTGKLRELQHMLSDTDTSLVSQGNLHIDDAEETGLTFIENAIIKARHACAHSHLAAIADDSGLEVDALHGAPGIYSSRYAGPDADDAANNRKLLRMLDGVPDEQRSARFHCVIVYMRHEEDPTPLVCHGVWEGRILHEESGHAGFGYDPLFHVPERQCSSAALPPDLKNRISHRARALQQLLAAWPAAGGGRP